MRQSFIYLKRYLEIAPSLKKESIELACWLLREDLESLSSALLSEEEKSMAEESYDEFLYDHDFCATGIWDVLKRQASKRKKALKSLRAFLDERISALPCSGREGLQQSLKNAAAIFSLSEEEKEFCAFFYLVASYEPIESFYIRHLECHRNINIRVLSHILGLSAGKLTGIFSGRLRNLELFEFDRHSVTMADEFQEILDKGTPSLSSKHFFPIDVGDPLPLEAHFIAEEELSFVCSLLKEKPKGAVNILLYGPPGTGKTTFARGIARQIGIPAYGITRGTDNTAMSRRLSLLVCLNMTNNGPGSLILVDEADNLLNTQFSWFTRGETQDKGWLNQILEEPGVRMIWITNHIGEIEESVLRRFAFSLHFKPFSKRQRALLWENVATNNKVDSHFKKEDFSLMASRYDLSAGAIDLAVKGAIFAGRKKRKELHEAIGMCLDAHERLINGGEEPERDKKTDRAFSLEGLSMDGDVKSLIARLEGFDKALRDGRADEEAKMALLFYGPPGSGKTELGIHISEILDRELVTRGPSDILGPWVGVSEMNLKAAFDEARKEEGILLIDEVDSFLFNRSAANHSWEMTLTNEFLTQLERFRGIIICTTNRLEGLDHAALRRFNAKIGFKNLTCEGKVIFYVKLLADLAEGELGLDDKKVLMNIPDLAPGDFKAVRERLKFQAEGLTHAGLIQALDQESKLKALHSGRKGTPGF